MWWLLAWQVSITTVTTQSLHLWCVLWVLIKKIPAGGRSVCSPRIETVEEGSEGQKEMRRWKQRERNFLHSSPNWISELSNRTWREERFERRQEQVVVGPVRHLQEPFWALHKGWLQKKCGHTDEMFLGTSYDRVLEGFNPEQNLDLRDSTSTWPK